VPANRRLLGVLLGAAAAIVAWLGWFQIAPALGFPTIGPAAMLNRVFVPHSNPGIWVGWILVVVALAIVAALYQVLEGRGPMPRGAAFGLLFGVAAWAIGGLILMPIIGHIAGPAPTPPPPPGPPIPTTPDPMHATLMMLHLGALAPVDALLPWLLFAAVLGSASAVMSSDRVAEGSARAIGVANPAVGLLGVLALATMLVAGGIGAQGAGAAGRAEPTFTGATIRVLSTGQAKALPTGSRFVSVIELPQLPGASLGPHGHIPGFAYVLRGEETIDFPGESAMRLGSGQAGFMSALAVHSHENRQGRLPAGLLALGLLGLGVGLVLTSVVRWPRKRSAVVGLTVLALAGGALALWNPWANDWFFIGVRPASARGGVMPLPNASRTYESPDLEGLSEGPYVETLEVITIRAGGRAAVSAEPGAETLLVLKGKASIEIDGGQPISLGLHQAAMAQQGAAVTLSNPGAGELDVLSFSVAPAVSTG
jgi:hypothetical protein